MPYKCVWVQPELYCEHLGVSVYRTYRDNDADQPMTYWFTTNETGDPAFEFDIRDLAATLHVQANNQHFVMQENEEALRNILRQAIENELLQLPNGQ